MKSRLIAGLSLAAISAVISTAAFADGGQGIGRAGTYQVQTTSAPSTKTRAEVRAELADAYSNGTLPALNRNTYPDKSMAGEAVAAQSARRAALAEQRNREIVGYANGSVTQSGVTAH
jgi:hypothetical protein